MPLTVRKILAPMAARGDLMPAIGAGACAISFRPSQWLADLVTLRRSVGVESMLFRTTSMWPSLKRSPKAAPRAQTIEARPLPVAAGPSFKVFSFVLQCTDGGVPQPVHPPPLLLHT